MPTEKLSTHEIRMAQNAERERHAREGTTPFTGYARPKPTQAELDEAARLKTARALPDDLFANEPEVKRLRAALHAKTTLIEKRTQVRDWLAGQQAQFEAAIEDAERAVSQAILEDAADQDDGFTKTREALSALEFSKSVSAYADAAYDMVAHSNPAAQHALYNARDAVRKELDEHLLNLKKAHVDARAGTGRQEEGGE